MSTMKEAAITGLSCSMCAAGLEKTLQAREGLESCRINFATGRIRFPAEREQEVCAVVAESEPGVRLKDTKEQANPHASSEREWRQAWRLILAALLFAALLAGEEAWDRQGLQYLSWGLALAGWLAAGWGVIVAAMRNLLHGRVFDENFLMTLATLGAFAVGHLPEAVGVMLFYHLGELVQDSAVQSSRNAITSLARVIPETSRRITPEGVSLCASDKIGPGEILEVWPGERVSHDGILETDEAWLDTSALTGESRPRKFERGMETQAGYLVTETKIHIRVTRLLKNSAVARIMVLVEEATQRKAKTERFMTRFAAVYTPLVVFSAVALAVLPPLLIAGASFEDWLFRALVFLVISCPCALVVSIPLGYFAGIGAASRHGILVKGGTVLDKLAKVRAIAFDKTGTITDGKFQVQRVTPGPGMDTEMVLALAGALEANSNHPIAAAIRAGGGRALPAIEDVREIRGRGVMGRLANGRRALLGSESFLQEECGIQPGDGAGVPGSLHLALDRAWAGSIEIDDAVRNTAHKAVKEVRELGVRTVALYSGDQARRTMLVGTSLQMDEIRGELLPEDKLHALETLMQANPGGTTVFVGDGINDAPVLRRADVGIAMGGLGSDAAIEAADAVLVQDDPLLVARGIWIARATRRVVWQNIVFALSFKAVFLLLGGLGLASLWEAVIADVGVALAALANAMRLVWSPRLSGARLNQA